MRYSLKRGIAALGPAGFLFEQYLEQVLQTYGYTTKRNVFFEGTCVSHEIDVVANKGNEHFFIEAKYHNNGGIKTDVTVAMYADARLLDIAPKQSKIENQNATHSMWLITNTKFTTTAIKYGLCKKIRMTSWTYPHGESLQDLIIKKGLYPVTVLPSIAHVRLQPFVQEKIMLVRDLASFTPSSLAERTGLSKQVSEKILSEALVALTGEGEKTKK